MKNSKTLNSVLFIPIVVLLVHFLYRIIDYSKIMTYFPLDTINDISSYIAQLFFLKTCGFHASCSYWYNGFTTFTASQPAWYFFTYPIYALTNNVLVSVFISLILIFVIAFIIIYLAGKRFGFSVTQRIAFFLFMFANAIAIGNFIRLGSITTFFGWVNFILLAFIFLWYKDKPLNKHYWWTILVYGIILLGHQTVTVLATFLFLSLFLTRDNWKERGYIILSGVLALAWTSFWWISYIPKFFASASTGIIRTDVLLDFSLPYIGQNIATLIVPAAFFFIFYLYWKQQPKKQNILFYAPYLLLAALLFLRIIPFIPIFNQVFPDAYLHAFLFFTIFLLFKLDFTTMKQGLQKLIFICLILAAIVSVIANLIVTPLFTVPGELEQDIKELIADVDDGSFLILADHDVKTSYTKAYYAYAPIFHGVKTPSGWYPHTKDKAYIADLAQISAQYNERDCSKLEISLQAFNVTDLISHGQECEFFSQTCGFTEKLKKQHACSFSL